MTLFSAFGSRPFALVWVGQTASRFGDAVYVVALAWWILQTTGSATAMGSVLIVEVVPTLLLLLVGGLAVDRLPRLKVMIVADALRAAVLLILAFLDVGGQLELWHVFFATAIFGSVTAFFYPAFTAVIPDITPTGLLPSANSLTQLSARFARVLGPALGAGLVAISGPAGAFAINGISFVISAVVVLIAARHIEHEERPEASESAIHQLRVGLAAVTGTPWLWVTIAVAAVSTVTLDGPLEAALPFLVNRDLQAGVEIFGMLGSVSAIGAIAASIVIGRRKRLRRRGVSLYGAWLVAALMVTAMGLPIGVLGVIVAMAIAGAALAVLGLVWTNSIQELVPKNLRGRVASIDALGSSALLPFGFGVTGFATDRIGPAAVFVFGGLISLAVITAGLLHPQVRNLD
jgi:hypothetical protein